MRAYRFVTDYASNAGTWRAGDQVELDDERAAWLERDVPGCIEPADIDEPPPPPPDIGDPPPPPPNIGDPPEPPEDPGDEEDAEDATEEEASTENPEDGERALDAPPGDRMQRRRRKRGA